MSSFALSPLVKDVPIRFSFLHKPEQTKKPSPYTKLKGVSRLYFRFGFDDIVVGLGLKYCTGQSTQETESFGRRA